MGSEIGRRIQQKCVRRSILFICAAVFMFFSAVNSTADVMINEFMALNVSTSPDMCDFDDFSDWIELYNNADTTVNLKGYYLTDKLANPTKWPIPDGTTIPPKGFLVIRADGSSAAPGTVVTRPYYPYDLTFTTKRYHTNFKFSDLGDGVGLFKLGTGSIIPIDTVTFTRQLPDVSMGRKVDGGKEWYKFDYPTPGSENTTDAKPLSLITYSPSVKFSAAPGFSSETQTVTITASSGTDNEIYYTTNGSAPSTNSNKYTGPVLIDKNTVLRARCINPSMLAGSVTTASYFVNETLRTLMRVSIVADSTYLWDSIVGMYQNSYKDKEIPASIEFFNKDGSFMTQVNAGINPGSLTSYTSPQKPLQIGLKGKYGSDFIVAQVFDKKAASYPKIRIRNAGDSWGTTMLGDAVIESMCTGQMDNGSSAYKPINLYINGKYWGVMELREQFDEQYYTNNFNVDPTSLTDIRTTILPPAPGAEGWELGAGTWDEYNEVLSMAKSGSMNDSARYKFMTDRIDVNSLMDYIAAEDFGANISWGHNIELWKVNGTKFRWLLCDFDRAFTYSKVALNLFSNGGGGISGKIIPKDTLFSKLVSNTQFKNWFVQRFAAHLNSTFSSVRMNGIVDSLYKILKPEMPDQIARWKDVEGSIQSMEAWESEVADMKKFMAERPANVFNHLKSQFELSGYVKLTIADDDAKGDIYINDVKMCAGTDTLTFFKNIPLIIRAVPKPGYVFAGWKDIATDNEISLTLAEDKTISAIFEVSERHILPLTVTSDTTLTLTDQPYVVKGDLEVANGATLTIAKGVTIALAQNAGIYVKGTMHVNGTADEPVTLKADDFSGASSWAAICFDNAEDTNTISYAIIRDCTLGRDALNHKGGINGNQSNVHMDHLTMSNIVYPLYFEGGNTILRNSTVTINHICNGGIHIGRGGALVENNDFVSTGVTMNTDAIDIKGVVDGIVRGNDVYNFNGPNSDGIDLGESAKNILVEGNIVCGNRDKGISVGGQSTAIIRNNIVADCDMGIGVKDAGSSAVLDHNTFVRCNRAVECYEKAYPRGGGNLTVTNSILAYSKVSTYVNDSLSPVTFSYCLSDIDQLPGTGNIKADPEFIDQLHFNFQLQTSSPALNAGNPDAEPDEDGSRTDIGAQYVYDPTDFPIGVIPRYSPSVVINEIMYKDNDAVGSKDWIELYNTTNDPVDISNWRLTDLDMLSPAVPLDVPALPLDNDGNLDSANIYFIPDQTVLAPNSYYVILKNSKDFFKAYPSEVTNYSKKVLNIGLDSCERVALYDCNNTLVTAARYGNTSPYPAAANGGGSSLELVNPNNYNFISFNWAASRAPGGTPGRVNSVYAIPTRKMNNVVKRFIHEQNFPNPFRASTTFRLNLSKDDHVSINIFSLSGKKLCTVVDTDLKCGVHQILWKDVKLASGIYIYRIKTSALTLTNKLNVR